MYLVDFLAYNGKTSAKHKSSPAKARRDAVRRAIRTVHNLYCFHHRTNKPFTDYSLSGPGDARRVSGRSFQTLWHRVCKTAWSILFSFWVPTDHHVLLNGDYGDQCTFLPDKMAHFRECTCRRWCWSCTLFADELVASVSRHVVLNLCFRMTSWALAFKTECRACRLAALLW